MNMCSWCDCVSRVQTRFWSSLETRPQSLILRKLDGFESRDFALYSIDGAFERVFIRIITGFVVDKKIYRRLEAARVNPI